MKGRNLRQCNNLERFYLFITIIGLLTGIGFALYGIIEDNFRTEDSSYLFIFLVNTLFSVFYVVKGMRYEDPYDLSITVLSVAPPITYVITDYSIGHHNTDLKLARLIIALPFATFIAGFGIKFLIDRCLTKSYMGYYITTTTRRETISESSAFLVSSELKKPLRTMLLYYFLIKVNLQVDLSASAFTLTSGYAIQLKSTTFIHSDLFAVFIPILLLSIVTFIVGYCAVRKENKKLVISFIVLSAVLFGAGLYLMITSVKDLRTPNRNHTLSIVGIVASILMIFIRIISLTGCYLTYQNFWKGLKEQVYGSLPEERRLLPPLDTEVNSEAV